MNIDKFRDQVYEEGRRLCRRYPRENLKLIVDFNVYDMLLESLKWPNSYIGTIQMNQYGYPGKFMGFPIEKINSTLGGYWELAYDDEQKSWDVTCPNCGTAVRVVLNEPRKVYG